METSTFKMIKVKVYKEKFIGRLCCTGTLFQTECWYRVRTGYRYAYGTPM
ncbi:hypothetical protein L195_g038374, partial [Trifolium pratense]